MSKKSRKTRSVSRGRHPVSRRLDDIRQSRGIKSMQEFHNQLMTRVPEGERVSYAATRVYFFDREAPASYLARVAEVFEVNLTWLITGQGSMEETLQPARNVVNKLNEVVQPIIEARVAAIDFPSRGQGWLSGATIVPNLTYIANNFIVAAEVSPIFRAGEDGEPEEALDEGMLVRAAEMAEKITDFVLAPSGFLPGGGADLLTEETAVYASLMNAVTEELTRAAYRIKRMKRIAAAKGAAEDRV